MKHARPEQPVREPLPLAAVYFLAAGRGAPIEPLTDGAPQLLLASSFVFAIRDSARLTNQLDVCAAVSRYAQLFLLRPEAAADWGTLGGLVREHLAASTPA